jgi:thiamine transporter ThiT
MSDYPFNSFQKSVDRLPHVKSAKLLARRRMRTQMTSVITVLLALMLMFVGGLLAHAAAANVGTPQQIPAAAMGGSDLISTRTIMLIAG